MASKHHRGETTRQSIMAAAEQIFADVGFATARLEDVAQAVGIRRPSIIYYFATKQELYDAVEADIFLGMHTLTAERTQGITEPRQRLIALLDAWLDFSVHRPTAARIIMRLVADATPRNGNPVEFSHSALDDLEKVINEGIAAGMFRYISPMHIVHTVAASALFYACNGKQLGEGRGYDAADPSELLRFREVVHRLAMAAVDLPHAGPAVNHGHSP